MNKLFVSILLSISSFLGSNVQPTNSNWTIDQIWTSQNNKATFSASTRMATLNCKNGQILELPMIIHGAHEIYIDNKLLTTFGDPTFRKASPFYLKPSIECSKLNGTVLLWKAFSYTEYFARFKEFPKVKASSVEKVVLLHEIFNIISGTGLLLLCFITSIIFFKKIPNNVFFANILANVGFAMYFIFSSSNYFALDIDMLHAHKFADIGVWFGISSFFYILYSRKLCSKISFIAICIFSMTAISIISIASNGDTIQFGTSLPFPLLICILIEATVNNFINLLKDFKKNIISTLSVLFFFFSGVYEIGLVVGIIDASPFLAIGILGVLVAISLLVQSDISVTYKQRDDLLNQLEYKVEKRTTALKEALKEKEAAQAELIQSAKLASLGTLSAGIAHEINNNINYVNACVMGLEKEFKKPQPIDSIKIEKLLNTIKHGTKMTIDIVNSLRNYTGLNQGQVKEVNFKDIILSVKNIIRRKLQHIQIKEEHDDTFFQGNNVSLNQIVMNLLTNAADALEASDKTEKILVIKSFKDGNNIKLIFKDNGTGIPDNIIDKIFDPFFTTKDVGSGTGLGLHIIKKEIDRSGGSITVDSSQGVGTTFTITLPLNKSNVSAA